MKGQELAEFELELANVKDAEIDKLAAARIGDLFREHGRAPALKNEDFFNHQLMQRIEADLPKAAAPVRRKYSWSLSRMAMAGAFSVLVAGGLYYTMVPKVEQPAAPDTQGIVQIINTKGGDPGISVSTFRSPENEVVIWVEGSKYVLINVRSPRSTKKNN